MGSEALSKHARRDIRRAYAPEASEEVLKFVDNVKVDLDQRLDLERARQREVNREFGSRLGSHDIRLIALETRTTFRQRLRSWLVTGSWQ